MNNAGIYISRHNDSAVGMWSDMETVIFVTSYSIIFVRNWIIAIKCNSHPAALLGFHHAASKFKIQRQVDIYMRVNIWIC